MNGHSSKLAYCALLLLQAAFVAMPQRSAAALPEADASPAPLSTEARLARAIHERIAVEASGNVPATQLSQLAAEEDGLRELAFATNAPVARRNLIDFLANELSAAMLQRSLVDTQQGESESERSRMDAVVRALTAAINAEVLGAKA